MNDPFQTAWVKPPHQTGGLDHLGVQAPCIQIYGQLLPGITNVTDRARYYSFYPWLFCEFEKKGWQGKDELIPYFRKADCLFSMIAIRHGQLTGHFADHAAAAVGSNTLTNIVRELENKEFVRLSDYTHFNDNDNTRYFKNPMGGLGQYYFGVLEELKIMSGNSFTDAQVIEETGGRIAKAMSESVPGAQFMEALESDNITADLLDDLSSFCHCCLAKSEKENQLLISVLKGGCSAISGNIKAPESADTEFSSAARAKTLGLLILLSGICAKSNARLDVEAFRGITYSRHDFSGRPIDFPEQLLDMVDHWQVYQRNEMLSVGMQGLFFALLRAADIRAGKPVNRFFSTQELSDWFWNEGPGRDALGDHEIISLPDYMNSRLEELPAFKAWNDPSHEMQLIESIVSRTSRSGKSTSDLIEITQNSLKVLAAVCCRQENKSGYGCVGFRPGYLDPYPVNLKTIPTAIFHADKSMSLPKALAKFSTYYCLDSHSRVAMRKLRQQGQNTSRFEVREHGLVIIEIPAATHTSPRFTQAMRILQDLGLIQSNKNTLTKTLSGQVFLDSLS